jgi:hypothetical protein
LNPILDPVEDVSPTRLAEANTLMDEIEKPSLLIDSEWQLSELEQLIVKAVRDSVDKQVSALRDMLRESEWKRYDLTSTCRSSQAWIDDLIATLNEHNIDVPPVPGAQYPGTPSSCASD